MPNAQRRSQVVVCLLAFMLFSWGSADLLAGGRTPGDMEKLRSLRLGSSSRLPWKFSKFPIIAWWGPPGTSTATDFERYRDAGFTLYAINPDEGFSRAIVFAEDAGLEMVAYREPQGFGLPAAQVDLKANGERFVGWIASDEPEEPAQVIRSITTVHDLMREDPSRWAFFNLLPPFAQKAPGTEAIIDVAVSNGLPILSYDHYIEMADGSTREQAHFDYLELFRRKSLEHDVPFWAFALTTGHYRYRRPSESDVRFKQYTNLAYGAKGLWYFTYWGPKDWPRWDSRAIVDPADGSPTELYKVVSDINHAVLKVWDLLPRLTSAGVYHTNPPLGCRAFEPDRFWISGLKGSNLLVGFFVDDSTHEYALLVNKNHGAGKSAAELAESVSVEFASDVTEVEALSWLDGEVGPLELRANSATLELGGGTGVLLRASMSKPTEPCALTRIIGELPAPDAVYTRGILRKVASWYIGRSRGSAATGSGRPALVLGLIAASDASGEKDLKESARMLAEDSYRAISSKPVPGVAECYALADCQLQLYDASISPAGYSKLTEWIDSLLAHTPQGRQMTEETDSVLFIAPMLARLSSVSGDQKYLDAALEKGLPTMAQAFNSSSNLFQSMPSFPGRRERNGELVFWARSNGLTFACYARLLEYLPAGTPYRSNVEKQFQAMSDAIVDLQDPDDGLWRAGLLDPESYPTPESSGSALLCYGLARGVNMGLLKEERHKQAALRAWKGVTACVYPDGGVGYVQTKGNGPERFAPDSTDELGAGAVLLAGSEVLKLLEGPNAPQ